MEEKESSQWSRRDFLGKAGLSLLATYLGVEAVYASHFPENLLPSAFMQSDPFALYKKDRTLGILGDQPLVMETPPHLLNDAITPISRFFVRNNGKTPENLKASEWTLRIDGESVIKERTFSLEELKKSFTQYSYQLFLECAGNGRAEFVPSTKGNQWGYGGVSCGKWTGVRLKDVLAAVGYKPDAYHVAYYGKDQHLSGDSNKSPISRAIPLSKALEEETLLAWKLNDQELPIIHGYPLRLVVGGYSASVSGKWLHRLSIRNKEHDGAKMKDSYRIPKYPIEPGEEVSEALMEIIGAMPVKSLITTPKTGAVLMNSQVLQVNGHAWAGDSHVSTMHTSIDFGATWQACDLSKAVNRNAWQQWKSSIRFPKKGYYEVWAKATDAEGRSQPMMVPNWNPHGYFNNACHRIAVKVL